MISSPDYHCSFTSFAVRDRWKRGKRIAVSQSTMPNQMNGDELVFYRMMWLASMMHDISIHTNFIYLSAYMHQVLDICNINPFRIP
jgi:hypothetical protein